MRLGFKEAFGDLITEVPVPQKQLTAFFSNLLSERHIRELSRRAGGGDPEERFFLFWALRQDLPGGDHR